MTVYKGTTIYHTHGDTLMVQVGKLNPDGTEYETEEGDIVLFVLRKESGQGDILIRRIPSDTMVLLLSSPETKALGQGLVNGHYVYDIKLLKANGVVDTFINGADLYLTEEV